jgi:hypothetical protein
MSGRGAATGALLVAAGVVWLAEAAGWIDLDARTWVGLLLIGIGLVLVVDRRSPHGLLVGLAILLLLLGIPLSALDADALDGGIGERIEAPRLPGGDYELGVGKLVVDLTDTDLAGGGEVEASVGIGELVVEVPPGVAVRVEGHAGMGNVELFGEHERGVDVDLETERPGDGPVLELDVSVGIGSLRVEEAF